MTKEDFLRLQKEWYARLQEFGFEDAEVFVGSELVLKQRADYPYRRSKERANERLKEEYFALMYQIANSETTIYRNETDRLILIRHSEGAKIKKIMEELSSFGVFRARDTIRYLIRRYEMAWGIRNYTREQLHFQDRKKKLNE